MLGYIFMVLALVLILPSVLFFMRRGRGPRPQGRDDPRVPVARQQPSADEPTPDANVPRDADGRSRIPPA